MNRIVLYYAFTPLPDPEAVRPANETPPVQPEMPSPAEPASEPSDATESSPSPENEKPAS